MTDKLCVVTGTSSGLGRAVAQVLLERGWRVVGLSRRDPGLAHEAYRHVSLDLGDLRAVEDYVGGPFAAEAGLERAGRVGLVNNAGVLDPVHPAHRLDSASLLHAFAVNTVAPVWLTGWFIGHAPPGPLRIVNVSSGAATSPMPGWTAYCSTKAALRMAGQVVGTEAGGYPRQDLALVSYAPGIVDTAMQARARSLSAEDFPSVDTFVRYHRTGALAPPERPAGEIAGLLEADGLPAVSERHFKG